jgi:hypothetical protein
MQIDGGWIIKNVQANRYLGYEGQHCDGNKLVATEEPRVWHIWRSEDVPDSFRYENLFFFIL